MHRQIVRNGKEMDRDLTQPITSCLDELNSKRRSKFRTHCNCVITQAYISLLGKLYVHWRRARDYKPQFVCKLCVKMLWRSSKMATVLGLFRVYSEPAKKVQVNSLWPSKGC